LLLLEEWSFRESNTNVQTSLLFRDVAGLRVVRDAEGKPVKPVFDITV
jgi:hypothetical protein